MAKDLNAMDGARDRLNARAPYDTRFEAISELMRPLRKEFFKRGVTTEGESRTNRSYDATGAIALDQAGSSIFSMITALGNDWTEFKFEDERSKRQRENREWLTEVNRRIMVSLGPSRSSFYNDSPETILDSIGLGTGSFFSSRLAGDKRLVDRAIPLAECSFSVTPWGEVSHFDRWYNESLYGLKLMFGEEALPKSLQLDLRNTPHKKHPIVHTTIPNENGSGRPRSVYMLQDDGEVLREGSFAEMPYFVSRWGVGSGETYGRGRGELALPDAQMVNEMSRTSIIAAQKIAEPPIALHDEVGGVVNLDPNSYNYGAIDDRGNQRIQPINLGGNLGITLEMQDQRRQSIKDAFYHAMLSMVGSPTPSVVEILKTSEARDQSMGPNLARIMSEFLAPFIEYRYRTLLRGRQLPEPPEGMRGQRIEVNFTSPLAKAASASKAQSVLNSAAAVAQIASIDPNARFRFDGDAAVRHVIDGLAAPPDILVSDDEYRARIQQATQKDQLEALLAQAESGSRSAEALARAGQAAA